MHTIFEVDNGEIITLIEEVGRQKFHNDFINKTKNLLLMSSACSLFVEKFLLSVINIDEYSFVRECLFQLFSFGMKLHVYLDQSDNHREYVAKNALQCSEGAERNKNEINYIISNLLRADNDWLDVISITHNYISKEVYKTFEKMVNKLYEFLKIFKSDLQGIEIDKKENRDKWVCDLVMVYDSYKIHAEYESSIIYANQKDEFTAIRFIYDSVFQAYDCYFLKDRIKSYKCPVCNRIYDEKEVAQVKVKRCFECDEKLEEIIHKDVPISDGNYTEVEVKILGIIATLSKEDAMSAAEISAAVGCNIQKVAIWGSKVLAKKGLINIEKREARNYYYDKVD